MHKGLEMYFPFPHHQKTTVLEENVPSKYIQKYQVRQQKYAGWGAEKGSRALFKTLSPKNTSILTM